MIHDTWIDKLKSSLQHDNWTDDATNKIVEALEKYQELADKYAAALGREAELKEQLMIERSKNRNMVERW